MDPKEFIIKKIKFLDRVSKTNEEIKTLEESTKNQSESELWKVERSIRLTASNVGKVCKLRATTSRKILLKVYYIIHFPVIYRQTMASKMNL